MGDDSYMLNNAAAPDNERERLNKQFFIMNEAMEGNFLPPHIARQIAKNPAPRICDMATGSAIWLTELAKTLPPSAELFGFDYDDSKFPRDGLPSNVKLAKADLYKPFPEDLQGTFDVVGIRLFYLAARKGKIIDMLKNLAKLLRPGGWFVWFDVAIKTASIDPPSDALFHFIKVLHEYSLKMNMDTSIPIGTLRYVKEASLTECDNDIRSIDGGYHRVGDAEWLQMSRWLFHGAIIGICGGIARSPHNIEGMKSREDLDDFETKLVSDMDHAERIQLFLVTTWGRRAL
ncbi:S-adenosyl-L-methionine-dependent methyltransferase [Xylariaceae sp. FL1272]|nr:S-adenosyl-L-methionine-dependent methyltransferase [Xylariaceae sp. FL1272]